MPWQVCGNQRRIPFLHHVGPGVQLSLSCWANLPAPLGLRLKLHVVSCLQCMSFGHTSLTTIFVMHFMPSLRNMKYFLIVVELTLNEPVCLNLVTALSQRESLKSTCCTDDSPLRLWVGRASFRTFKVNVCTYLFLFKRLGRGCPQLLGRVLCRYDTRCYHLHHQKKINKIKVAQTGRSAWNLTQPHGERVTIRQGIAQRGHLWNKPVSLSLRQLKE